MTATGARSQIQWVNPHSTLRVRQLLFVPLTLPVNHLRFDRWSGAVAEEMRHKDSRRREVPHQRGGCSRKRMVRGQKMGMSWPTEGSSSLLLDLDGYECKSYFVAETVCNCVPTSLESTM